MWSRGLINRDTDHDPQKLIANEQKNSLRETYGLSKEIRNSMHEPYEYINNNIIIIIRYTSSNDQVAV